MCAKCLALLRPPEGRRHVLCLLKQACRAGAARLSAFLHHLYVLNRRIDALRQERLERTKSEIAARIRRVCDGMSPEEFDLLVSHMAEVQIKYTLRRSTDMFPDTGGDRGGERH